MERGQYRGMKRLYHYTPMLILTIITTALMIVTEALVLCNTMVFNTDFYVWIVSESGADNALYNELETYFKQLSSPTGIPSEVYTKSLEKKNVSLTAKKLVKMSLDYTFGKTNTKPVVSYDYTQFESDVTEYIENYTEANHIEKDADYYTFIDNTINVAEKKMDSSFDIMMTQKLAESSIPSLTRRFVPSINIMLGVCVGVMVGFMLLMYYVDRHHPFDLPYWLGTILFSGSAIFLIPSIYCRATGYFDGFFMEEQSLYYAITGSIYGVIDRVILVNSILFAFGVVLMIFAQIIHVFRVKDAKEQARLRAEEED